MKIVKKSYDQLLAKVKSYRILNHYRKLIFFDKVTTVLYDKS